ncbi:hypothetical protein [Corynebacterium xerosis]|uniref:hypothetical protein n=1 Tax=Corynebacterium xerosis TaxID=1725 RepID=UPI00215516F4|nr:hypothetical protein [Corynebacterium xerosis]
MLADELRDHGEAHRVQLGRAVGVPLAGTAAEEELVVRELPRVLPHLIRPGRLRAHLIDVDVLELLGVGLEHVQQRRRLAGGDGNEDLRAGLDVLQQRLGGQIEMVVHGGSFR